MKRVKIIRNFNSNKKTTRLSNTLAYPSLGPRPRLEFALRICHLQTSVTTRILLYFPYLIIIEKMKRLRLCGNDVILMSAILKRWNNRNGSRPKLLQDTSASFAHFYVKREQKYDRTCSRQIYIINIHKSICKASFGFSGEWDVKICKHYSIQTEI